MGGHTWNVRPPWPRGVLLQRAWRRYHHRQDAGRRRAGVLRYRLKAVTRFFAQLAKGRVSGATHQVWLAVNFQEVVHSARTRSADVAKQTAIPGRPKWKRKLVGLRSILAKRLPQGVLDEVWRRSLRIVSLCWFVREFVERNPEYRDLMASPSDGETA